MTTPITVLASIKLAKGKSEADLIKASDKFQDEFASKQPGLIRRELIRKGDGEYLDIVQFRSKEDAEAIIKKEKESPACHAFFLSWIWMGTMMLKLIFTHPLQPIPNINNKTMRHRMINSIFKTNEYP